MKLPTLAILALCQLVGAQVSTVNGVAQFAGTPVQQNPHGIPTLIYNCAKLPAICQNVNRRNPLTPRPGAGFGALQGATHVELHYDTNSARKNVRRTAACSSSTWKNNHPCPESNQPATVPKGSMLGSGSFAARRYVDPTVNPPLTQGDAGYNAIANAAGMHSGMMWTCDEWPPATAVEGGAGANTICAPQNAACAPLPAGVGGVDSEQNFQSSAHTALRQRIWSASNPNGIFRYHFKTVWYGSTSDAATQVEWYMPASEFVDNYGNTKRFNTEPLVAYKVVDHFYSNGTTSQTIHPLTRRQLEGRDELSSNETISVPAGHQGFENLDTPPLLPFIDVAREFITSREENQVAVAYIEKAVGSSRLNKTETTPSNSSATGPRLRKAVGLKKEGRSSPFYGRNPHGLSTSIPSLLDSRAARQCDPKSPCPDGSCCNKSGQCGFGKEVCGPDVCVSNCNATALCGRESLGGAVKCPLNVCCSYHGYCGVGEEFCVGTSPTAKCQQGFGRCETVSAPTCGGSSATGRTIGYYQVGNVRDRQCNRIRPAQIKTEGLTHLYLAFASIDPNSLKVIPANADDVALYKEFTALKSSKLQTWVAIGGWDFSDPGPTRTAFNDAARTPARRKTFINSLVAFLTEHGFQGVDIDWEYPGAPDRGGTSVDTDNYVTLIKEMRAAFGTKFGISMAIPASYWYLRWFKPKEMEPYVDWFGIMTYDLHGPWDKDVKQIGTVVLGHTNIPEIANWTLPLWYDGVNPAKVNMGLAYYSRGYTLADANCNSVGCQWKGPSRPGQCTNFGGVHSLQEIQRLITQLGVQPKLLAADMMKQLTFGDQWIGYDDMETIAMKRQWANNHCFGGTMIWSVDMFSGSGSGDTPDGGGSTDPGNPGGGQGDGSGVIYIDPSIYEEGAPEVKCQPPCTFILPPKSLTKATTITFPPYVTSLDVAWSASTGWTSIVQTTTITIPPVTTTEIEVWAYTVSGTRTTSGAYSTFRITPSIRPSPFTIKDDPNPLKQSGVSHPPVTRTITPPPWPYTYTPPGGGRPTTTSKSSSDPVVPIFPIVTWKPGPQDQSANPSAASPASSSAITHASLTAPTAATTSRAPTTPSPQRSPPPPLNPTPQPSGTPTKPVVPRPKGHRPQKRRTRRRRSKMRPRVRPPLAHLPPARVLHLRQTAPSAPTPKPPPPPDPPKPNRDTEKVDCYNSGQFINRGLAIEALEYFCDEFEGTVLDASVANSKRTLSNGGYGVHCIGEHGSIGGCFVEVQISVTVKNGCKFKMEGKGANQECGRIIRRMIDECDESSTQFKQGGRVSSNCADWRFDPNNNW